MQAGVVDVFGTPANIALKAIARPTPKAGEVLVQVHATAANFVDLLIIAGEYQFRPTLPFIPGKGPAGTVFALGSDVTDLQVGDRVLAMAEQGGYAQYVTVAADQCYQLPKDMSFVEAASMAVVYDTAWMALHERGRIMPGEVVLVLGASGGVGQAAIQLAKAMQATVLAGISTPEKSALVPDADAIIDLSAENLRDALRDQVNAVTNGGGADIILDPLGGDIFDAALRALAWRGRMVVIGFAAGRIPNIRTNYLLLKNIEVSGLQISDYRKRAVKEVAECFNEVFAFYQTGRIKPRPATSMPLSEVGQALESIRNRSVTERLVITQTH